jgi:hypothetical protein
VVLGAWPVVVVLRAFRVVSAKARCRPTQNQTNRTAQAEFVPPIYPLCIRLVFVLHLQVVSLLCSPHLGVIVRAARIGKRLDFILRRRSELDSFAAGHATITLSPPVSRCRCWVRFAVHTAAVPPST